jgi:transcriptional regulator with XRE-family HTH domain
MSLELLKDKISYHLENKKISVAEFERSAGLKQSAVRNILYGKSKSPTIDTIQVIAREMKISVDELLSSKNDSKLMISLKCSSALSQLSENTSSINKERLLTLFDINSICCCKGLMGDLPKIFRKLTVTMIRPL